ncbi:MAG: hypothetical protein MJZ15_02405 [Bacteroidales bacterium]|nr:hypothetical protein [Bacteroidales bacterium]
MKKFVLTIALIAICCTSAFASLSNSKIRTYARFLTDRMAYELDLNAYQYEDCYEVNYDFLHAVNPLLDDMVYGYIDAIDRYYDFLDYRNDDLRYILSARQYLKFIDCEYFHRPIYSTGHDWALRIYTIYSNKNFYYYDAPLCYKSYTGLHSRVYHSSGYYINRHTHVDHHTVTININKSANYDRSRRSDFGVNIKNRNGNKYDVNNYNNRNQQNRTSDSRYKDNSNNKYSPEINNRNNGGNKTISDNNNKSNSSTTDNGSRTRTSTNTNSNSGTTTNSGSSNRSNANTGRR